MTESIPFWHHFQQVIIKKSPAWNQVLFYCLAIFSTFSISGTDTTIVGLYLICILNLIVNRHYWQVPVVLWRAILLFILCVWISGLVSPYTHGGRAALLMNWRLFLPFVLYLIFAQLNLSHWIQFFSVFLCLIALYGIVQFFTGADWLRPSEEQITPSFSIGTEKAFRARGNFSHALTYAGYLLLLTPLMGALSLCSDLSGKFRKWYGLVALTMLGAIVFSMSRSVWLGVFIASWVLSFRFGRKIPLFLAATGCIVITLMVFSYTLTESRVQQTDSRSGFLRQRFISSFMPFHNQERLHIWQAGWQSIQDHPLFGIGARNRGDVMPSYRDAISQHTGYRYITGINSGAHNIFLEILIIGGLFSLLSFLLIWFLFFRQNWTTLRQTRDWTFYPCLLWGGTAGILGYLVAGIFENNFLDGEVQTAVLLVLAICLYCQVQIQQMDSEKVAE